MNRPGFKILVLLCWMLAVIPAAAQGSDRYDYCRDRARDISGYFGPVPAEYERRGGALRGALKGAAAGATLGWITDSDRKKAARRGAALGAIAGAIKKAKRDEKRRNNEAKRRRYEFELDACMDDRR